MESILRGFPRPPARSLSLAAVSLAFLLAFVPMASASGTANFQTAQNVTVPATLKMTATMTSFPNNPGPQITYQGTLYVGGLDALFTFQNSNNSQSGPHQYQTSTAMATLVSSNDAVTIPKQPVDGGVGGNPFVWIQFTDPSGNALTDPIFLGRCAQGLTSSVDTPLNLASVATLQTSAECSNKASYINLSSSLTMDGVNAKLIFQNNDNPQNGPHQNVQTVDFTVIPAGMNIAFNKQPSLGGVGGNPWIWVQFIDGNGNPLTGQIFPGRCVQSF